MSVAFDPSVVPILLIFAMAISAGLATGLAPASIIRGIIFLVIAEGLGVYIGIHLAIVPWFSTNIILAIVAVAVSQVLLLFFLGILAHHKEREMLAFALTIIFLCIFVSGIHGLAA